MTVQEQIQAKLKAALTLEFLEVENQSHLHSGHQGSPGTGESHFHLHIKSAELQALSRVNRYRKVHEVLAEELAGPVHALSMTFLQD